MINVCRDDCSTGSYFRSYKFGRYLITNMSAEGLAGVLSQQRTVQRVFRCTGLRGLRHG
jgi:hypothetical protein